MEQYMEKQINGKIEVLARRWFQRSFGNTYHSVQVFVNGEVLENRFAYGYGSHYKQTAHELLVANDYDVPESYLDFLYLENLTFDVSDVDRKKDL